MRCSAVLLLFALTASACALPLDAERPLPGAIDAAPPPTLSGCPLLVDEPHGLLGAGGRVRTLPLAGGATLVSVDALHTAAGDIAAAVFTASDLGAGACMTGLPTAVPAHAGVDVSPLGGGLSARLLDVFAVGDQRLAYIQTYIGLDASGIALGVWDEAAQAFVAGPEYLFTADRPEYGDAVLVDGDTVYAYGCQGAGFLSDDCFVARVAADHADDRTAYEFYCAGGGYTGDIDGAWPIFSGGRGLAVARRGDRVYAAYATPLAQVIEVRSGLGPSGPWSAPVAVTACELPAAAFCGDLSTHPGLDADPAWLTLSYGVGSFDPLPAADLRSRIVAVPLADLP